MKKTYYKNLKSKKLIERVEMLMAKIDETKAEYKHWSEFQEKEKLNPTVSKKSMELTEEIVTTLRTKYVTLIQALDYMGISRYKIFAD